MCLRLKSGFAGRQRDIKKDPLPAGFVFILKSRDGKISDYIKLMIELLFFHGYLLDSIIMPSASCVIFSKLSTLPLPVLLTS